MLFGVTAPRAVRPALGTMTGWDENFDKKFDLATKLDVGGVHSGNGFLMTSMYYNFSSIRL